MFASGWSWKDEDGQDTAEYALIAALILVLVVGTIRIVWSAINHLGQ